VLGLVLLLTCAATIAPWTIRNWQTYGGLLLLDTIGAYNLWRDNALPGENFTAQLARLPNPIEQQRLATERGLHNLRTYPERFLARLPATTLYLWHLELDSYARGGGYFEDQTNRSDSFGWVLLADAAHLAVSGLALVGLALAPWRRGRDDGQRGLHLLLLLWILANLASGIVFHSESRFRIPYQPQMIVFAALPLAAWATARAGLRAAPWRGALAAGLLLLLLAGAWSPRLLPVLHMRAWVAAGDLVGRWQPATALAAYERAVAAFPTSDRPHVILGDAHRRLGGVDGAIAAYEGALAVQPHNLAAAAPLVHLYMQRGQPEEAQRVLRLAATSDTDLLAWAWRAYVPPPVTTLDIGDGLEFGYLINVYPPERNEQGAFRWTNGQGVIRLPAPPGGATRLTLRLNGTRLDGPPARSVQIVVNGQVVDTFAADGSWQERTVDLRPLNLAPGRPLQVEVRGDSFVPARVVPGSRDNRRLGVALDWVTLE
jgi:tetratricopeptide (TPR) repeat protein